MSPQTALAMYADALSQERGRAARDHRNVGRVPQARLREIAFLEAMVSHYEARVAEVERVEEVAA